MPSSIGLGQVKSDFDGAVKEMKSLEQKSEGNGRGKKK